MPRTAALAALAALTITCTTGCGQEQTVPAHPAVACQAGDGPLVLVASGRQHSAQVRVDGALREVITAAVRHGQPVLIVGLDGEPALVWKRDHDDAPANNRAFGDYIDESVAAVAARLSRLRADSPQVDNLRGLAVGADLGRGRSSGGVATVLMIDSGLQTTAPLNYARPGVLGADATEVVEHVRSVGGLPDLTGVNVLYAGLGATTAPQLPPSDSSVARLTEVYEQLAEAAGAHCVATLPTVTVDVTRPGLPTVDLVPVPQLPEVPGRGDTIVLHNDTIGFLPESEEFRDKTAAAATLAPIVAALQADPNAQLTITGTCASGTGYGRDPIELSTARAEAVATLLIAEGISPERISTVGVGTQFAEFVPDLGADGRLLPGPATLNRSVRLRIH